MTSAIRGATPAFTVVDEIDPITLVTLALPVVGVDERPILDLIDDDHGTEWDRRTNHHCRACAKEHMPCSRRVGDAYRWRPGDPIYRSTP